MSDAKEMKRRQREIEELAREFSPPQPKRYVALLPFRSSIETLRVKGASYRRIADILRDHGVSISHDTVRLFCQECLEENPITRRMIRQNGGRSVTGQSTEHQTNGMTDGCQTGDEIADAELPDHQTQQPPDRQTDDTLDVSQPDNRTVDAKSTEHQSDRQTQGKSDDRQNGDVSIGRKLAELRQKSDRTTEESSTHQSTGGPRIANPRDV